MSPPPYSRSVFLNAPFDADYAPLMRAMVFTVYDCGFVPRSALEADDSSETRISKLYRIIESSRYGIHDISRTQLDRKTRLPRFNMPLELGIFLGAKQYGSASDHLKRALVLDRDRYRYQRFVSDISGQDIRSHGNSVNGVVESVREWLRTLQETQSVKTPGSERIKDRYRLFRTHLPKLCRSLGHNMEALSFLDFSTIVVGWLALNPL